MTDETKPCHGCGGAGVDALADPCSLCRGYGFLPAPCVECGEPTEGEFCSLLCDLVNAEREGRIP